MKKTIRYILFATAVLFSGPLRPAHAAPLEADLREKTVVFHSTFSFAANVSTHVVLVSLASATWPNPTSQTGYINVTNILITLDKVAASSCTVRLGVVTFVNTSTGSVKYFFDVLSNRNVSNTVNSVAYFSDNSFRCLKVIPASFSSNRDGITPFLISNEITSGSPVFQSDVMLPSVNVINAGVDTTDNNGNIFPGLGDIVLSATNNDMLNAVVATVDISYHLDSR